MAVNTKRYYFFPEGSLPFEDDKREIPLVSLMRVDVYLTDSELIIKRDIIGCKFRSLSLWLSLSSRLVF